jgi:hypothetical protein
VFLPVHSGERVFRNNRSHLAMVSDLRVALLALQRKLKAVPAKRLD